MTGWRWTIADWRCRIVAAIHCLRGDPVLHRMRITGLDYLPFPCRIFALDPPRKGDPNGRR